MSTILVWAAKTAMSYPVTRWPIRADIDVRHSECCPAPLSAHQELHPILVCIHRAMGALKARSLPLP
jgi:hypothetical protein